MLKLKIFNGDINIRSHSCSFCGHESHEIKPYVNFYIRLTDACQAKCKFCEYSSSEIKSFNFFKLEKSEKEKMYDMIFSFCCAVIFSLVCYVFVCIAY